MVRASLEQLLGSAVAMGATMGPLLEQLGILDEFKKLAKPTNLVHVFEEGLGSSFVMDFTGRTALYVCSLDRILAQTIHRFWHGPHCQPNGPLLFVSLVQANKSVLFPGQTCTTC